MSDIFEQLALIQSVISQLEIVEQRLSLSEREEQKPNMERFIVK